MSPPAVVLTGLVALALLLLLALLARRRTVAQAVVAGGVRRCAICDEVYAGPACQPCGAALAELVRERRQRDGAGWPSGTAAGSEPVSAGSTPAPATSSVPMDQLQ